jgi:hypothetical protein
MSHEAREDTWYMVKVRSWAAEWRAGVRASLSICGGGNGLQKWLEKREGKWQVSEEDSTAL